MVDIPKYRSLLYHALWLGELTPEQEAEQQKNRIENIKERFKKGPSGAPMSALQELRSRRDASVAGAKRPDS